MTNPMDNNDPRLTAYVLGELDESERTEIEALVASDPELAKQVDAIRETTDFLQRELSEQPVPGLSDIQRKRIERAAAAPGKRRRWVVPVTAIATVGGAVAAGLLFMVSSDSAEKRMSARTAPDSVEADLGLVMLPPQEDREVEEEGRMGKRDSTRQTGQYAMDGRFALYGSADEDRKVIVRPRDVSGLDWNDQPNQEAYDHIGDNPFFAVKDDPRSTFSIDVDTASYANVRRMLRQGRRPPKGSVRIEEMINYFSYDYEPPNDREPFSIHSDVTSVPWAPGHSLLRIGLKGKELVRENRKRANLVFLIDVSGSMQSPNKLPLLKTSMGMLIDNLEAEDRIAIVVYAGSSGLVLPSTPVSKKGRIMAALGRLRSGGSTNGGAGIRLAYQIAAKNFVKGGVNRVLLATDGDFNVGTTDQSELIRLIEKKAKSDVFLTVLGFGMGNLNDSALEKIADHGNGHYAYIDTINEARKVLVDELDATLVTIAKDVKIQIEFNPAQVAGYRLIGYENRVLAHRDFNDDTKDAGEIGAGHTVTALYELVPPGQAVPGGTDPLKYQSKSAASGAASSDELLTVKLRYKAPTGTKSQLSEYVVPNRVMPLDRAPVGVRFAAAVAAFGMYLRESPHRGDFDLDDIEKLAGRSLGADRYGYRGEFLELVQLAGRLR